MSDPDHPVSPILLAAGAQPGPALDRRSFTAARVALVSTGASITTRDALEFSLAHAMARDAVHSGLAVPSLLAALHDRNLPVITVRSAADSRAEYLRRPDLGRTLNPNSADLLSRSASAKGSNTHTLSLILADGLSALASERHALGVLDALLPLLDSTWSLAPIVVAEQARVALADEIGQALHADATVILIGERPGLSSPDSLGAYITWAPRRGRTNAERNCISNIRTEGLDYASAAARIAGTLSEARRLGLTGVALSSSNTPSALESPPPGR